MTKSARPVTVIELVESDPGRFNRYTGTIASFKSDEIGFEVAGRVEFVAEPETDIIGNYGADGDDASADKTLLARLDSTHYELTVNSSKAAIATAEKQREAAQIELDSVIPAQQKAAEAKRYAAETERSRQERPSFHRVADWIVLSGERRGLRCAGDY